METVLLTVTTIKEKSPEIFTEEFNAILVMAPIITEHEDMDCEGFMKTQATLPVLSVCQMKLVLRMVLC